MITRFIWTNHPYISWGAVMGTRDPYNCIVRGVVVSVHFLSECFRYRLIHNSILAFEKINNQLVMAQFVGYSFYVYIMGEIEFENARADRDELNPATQALIGTLS